MQVQAQTLTPATVPPSGGLQISDQILSRTLNPNEDVGLRLVQPLPRWQGYDSTFSVGLDWKNYRSTTIQEHVFQATIFVPEFGSTGPPFTRFPSPAIGSTRVTFSSVQYLPFSVGLDASRADRSGATAFNLNGTFQFANVLSTAREFQHAALDREADGRFFVLTAGLTREQKLGHDWGVRLHADGQWANEPLLSNEQFSLGGTPGVRGYHDGEQFGDTGWRVQVEPHSPYLNLGMVDGTLPMLMRFYAFFDYGQRYHLGNGIEIQPVPNAQPKEATLSGVGFGFNTTIGERMDLRLQLGWALHDTPPMPPFNQPDVRRGDVRAVFGIGIQF